MVELVQLAIGTVLGHEVVHRLQQLGLVGAQGDAHLLLAQDELVLEGVGWHALGDLGCHGGGGADGIHLAHDERYANADEFLTIWRRLLSGETVDFAGQHFQIQQGRNFFPPVQKPYPPLYFGGSSEAAHELAAKRGLV